MVKKMLFLSLFSVPFLFSAQNETPRQSKFSIVPSVGFAWRIAELPSGLTNEEENYLKGLKSGLNFDISAFYHLKGIVGIGFKYSNYSASSERRFAFVDGAGYTYTGKFTTKDMITFFGPSVSISNFNEDTKHKMYVDMALGAITYTTKTADVKGTGSSLGAELNVAYQYQIHKSFLIGPKLGLSGGTLSKMKINGVTYNLDDDQKEGLSRVSLSAAATFRF